VASCCRARRIKQLRAFRAWHRRCLVRLHSSTAVVIHDYEDAVAALVQQLTAYLRDNPLACDTQEGIARWWLAPGAVVDNQQLSLALERMRQRGEIEQLRAADGRVRYRRIAATVRNGGGTQTD